MHKYLLNLLFLFLSSTITSQNLVVDGSITSSNANWGGGAAEAPFTGATFENTYLTTGCNANYIMEVDQASNPQQVVNGFTSGSNYTLVFSYAWRNTGCNASNNPTSLVIQFTDALAVLNVSVSVPNTTTVLTPVTFNFTNNASTSHTLKFTNPVNTNTCGVIVDNISIIRNSSPGGVGTGNLTTWFKAENIGIVDGASVYGWISQGTNNVVMRPPCATAPVYRTGLVTAANSLVANFNPYLTFNGATQYLEYTTARLNLNDLAAAGAGGSYFAAYMGGSNNLFVFGHQGTTNSRIIGKNTEVVFANTAGAGTSNDVTFTKNSTVNINSFNGKSNGVTIKDLNGVNQAAANGSADVDYLTFGVRRNGAGAYSQYYDGQLSEIMTFNSVLTNTQMQQIRSYLATKYGVTLADNSTTAGLDEKNYLASNGATTYWNATTNAGYHNNVTIIGRDDNTSLDQRKSISTDADANGFMANSMLTINNNAAFSSDISYLAAGHNGITLNTVTELVDIPASLGIQSRMPRFWKFQKTGAGVSNNVILTFDMTGFAPLTGGDLRLIVSTTNSFLSATTTVVAGAYAAPNFTVTMSTIGGVYFTVGSINAGNTPLPIELTSFTATCQTNNVLVEWTTATETNNDFFNVEKSLDGISYVKIATLQGVGNSNNPNSYSIKDNNPYFGSAYYRLVQTDNNGVSKTFSPVTTNCESSSGNSIYAFNNQSGSVIINSQSEVAENYSLSVFDSQARKVDEKKFTTEKGTSSFKYDISTLSGGVYFLYIECGKKNSTLKFFVK